jgi:YndJ-like protein
MEKRKPPFLFDKPLVAGFIIWLLQIAFLIPFSPYANEQVIVLLLAAPLFILPACLALRGDADKKLWVVLAAAILFSMAFHLPKGIVGALLVVPWWLIAAKEIYQSWKNELSYTFQSMVSLAATIFWMVAASWAIPDRLGYSPLDYEPIIILLTVVHFHYAGYILLQLYLLALPFWNKSFARVVGILLLAGMPLVALGISSSQVGLPAMMESLAVTVMAMGGVGMGLGYVFLWWKNRNKWSALLWLLCGISLLGGMSLALLYGWRFHLEYSFLSIPWMYAVHGTLNSMGFAFLGVLGWLVFGDR